MKTSKKRKVNARRKPAQRNTIPHSPTTKHSNQPAITHSKPAKRPAGLGLSLKAGLVFAIVVIGAMSVLAGGYLTQPTATPVPQVDYEPLAVRGLLDYPANYDADEFYTYSLAGQSTRVGGIVFKPTPCDAVKASAARDLTNGGVTVLLEFAERREACADVITPSKFSLFVDGIKYGEKVSVTAQTRLLELNASEQFCGGIAGFRCPAGWQCALDGDYPDAGGKCVKA